MLDFLNLLPIGLQVVASKAKFKEAVGIEEVLDLCHEGNVKTDLLQLSSPIEDFVFLPPGLNDVVEEREQVQDERVPHEVEGGACPVDVPIVEEVREGDAVC